VSTTAPLGQVLPHTPQETQRISIIRWCSPLSPVMAKTGQSLAQAVQPIQASVI